MRTRLGMLAVLVLPGWAVAWQLEAWPEFFRPDPFGQVVSADWRGEAAPLPLGRAADGWVHLKAPRNGYVSLHLVVRDERGGPFTLTAKTEGAGIEIDLFREWFHRNAEDGKYYPDALIPLRAGQQLELPDEQMRIAGQKAAAIWVDVWVSKRVRPGSYEVRIELAAGRERVELPVRLEVLSVVVPDGDAITADHNCYGVGWVSRYFPQRRRAAEAAGKQFVGSDAFFEAIHATHRLFYEHRGLFHQLGTSHTGRVNPVFAPELTGSGRNKRIKSWDYFDRHYGPLLDGSAFADTRRGPRPIESVYLTTTPEWPASYLWWGQPAYEVEFVNVFSQMEKHFRQKGWTKTCFEMFFNHKKRYKAFCWDGDETRFPKDNAFFKEFGRLLKKAIPADSPVRFVFRADASWLMRQQFDELAGVVNFWVCGSGTFAFWPEAVAMLKGRGDKVWIYGGPATAFGPSVAVLEMPVKAWMFGVDGFLHWLVTGMGADPWFKFDGGRTCMIYPGERFGLDKPLAGVRLKIQRNCLQDIALLDVIGRRIGGKAVRRKVAGLAGGARPQDWWNPDAPVKKLPPWQWSNSMLRDAAKPPIYVRKKLDGRWWLAVREFALARAQEVSR